MALNNHRNSVALILHVMEEIRVVLDLIVLSVPVGSDRALGVLQGKVGSEEAGPAPALIPGEPGPMALDSRSLRQQIWLA